MSDKVSEPKKRGPKPLNGEKLRITFRLRQGRSSEEDNLLDRLKQLPARQRSRFIRRVLTTGDMTAVLEREFARESEHIPRALDTMLSFWDDEEEDE